MPAYRTMGRDRSLTLFYSSAMAAPRPVVAAAVSLPSGYEVPNSVFAELKINGVARASATYYAFSSGTTVQIALAYDASGDASGIYPFTLEIRNVYSGTNYSTTVSGEVLLVNRSASEFSAGWWLAGVEQLVLGQTNNRILWLGGDGSAAVYDSVAPATWVRAAGAYRDTLIYTPGFKANPAKYTRALRHGVQVVYNAGGRHWKTIARTGATTVFTWAGSPVRLISVDVPPGGTGTTYLLAYEGAYQFIDYIQDPGGRRIEPYVSTYLYGTKYGMTYVDDADGGRTSFAYDGVGRMTGRTSRRSYQTTFAYANGLHVTRTAVPLAPPDSSRATFQWWDEKGLAVGIVGGMFNAVDTTAVNTVVDGPRTDVLDVATFWVDRWGAPTRIQDPAGGLTTITRGDAAMPALATRMQTPAGQVWGMAYDARGNLLSQADSTHEGHGTGGFQVAKTRYTYADPVNRWAPDSVIDPEGVITRMQYDTLGPNIATAANGHQTQFAYVRTGTLRGLVDSIIELQVPTYSDTVSWGTSYPLLNQSARFFYNSLGNLDSARSAQGALTRYTYNSYTQVIRQVGPTGDSTLLFPRAMGVVDSVINVDPAGPDRRYWTTFDADLSRTSLIDPRGVTRSWQLDAAGRDTVEVDDHAVGERRFVGPSGLLDSVRTRASVMIRRSYDASGRLTQIRYPAREAGDIARGDTVNMTYDVAGRMLTASNRSGTSYRSYYREGSVRQDSQVLSFSGLKATHQYRYDRADRRTRSLSLNGAADAMQVDYQYSLGQLDRMIIDYPGSSPATDTAVFTWDAVGRRQQLLTPHGATMRWFYDLDGRLRRVYSTHSCVNGPSYCPTYDSAQADRRYPSYDRSGRPLSMFETVGNHPALDVDSFAYDSYGQMRLRAHNTRQRNYTYDLSGNMRSEFYASGGSTSGKTYFVAPSHNRVLADSGWNFQGGTGTPRLSYSYSSAGERTVDSTQYAIEQRRRMWYDAMGRMTTFGAYAVSPGVVVDVNDGGADTLYYTAITYTTYLDDCRYDAVGRRVKACQGAPMLFDGDNADVLGGSGQARIVYGPGTNDPLVVYYRDLSGATQLNYFVTDGGGRLVSYTDSTGKDARTGYGQVYSEYAVHAGAVNNAESFGGSGSETAGVPDISFFRNRYYDQRTGRWLTEDPIGVAGGANLYQYSGNNPATYADPFGLCPDPRDPTCEQRVASLSVGVVVLGVKYGARVGPARANVSVGASAEGGVAQERELPGHEVRNHATASAEVGIDFGARVGRVGFDVHAGPSTEPNEDRAAAKPVDGNGTIGATVTVPVATFGGVPVAGITVSWELNIPAAVSQLRNGLTRLLSPKE